MLTRFGPSLWKSKKWRVGRVVLKILLIHPPVGKMVKLPATKIREGALINANPLQSRRGTEQTHQHQRTQTCTHIHADTSRCMCPDRNKSLPCTHTHTPQRRGLVFTSSCPSCETAVNVGHIDLK